MPANNRRKQIKNQKSRIKKFLFILASLLTGLSLNPSVPAAETSNPAILFCTPRGIASRPYLDLDWLREIHQQGFEPDYIDSVEEFTWDRIRQYNILVLFEAPPEGKGFPWGKNFIGSHLFPAGVLSLEDYIGLVDRFLEAGGGVYLSVYTLNADNRVRKLIEPWGARLPLELHIETDETQIVPLPRMRGYEYLSFTDNIDPSPVSDGVNRLWLPYGRRYNASWTGPIAVSKDWQVVVRGSPTSHTEPVDLETSHWPGPPDPLVRPGGVKVPDLMAIRSFKNGRIFLQAQIPLFSFGQGTQWLYDRHSLSKGLNGIPSDYERLILNSFRWLAEPSLKAGGLGGFNANRERLTPPNLRPAAKEKLNPHFHSSNPEHPVFRGLIGAETGLTGGTGTIAEFAAAAKSAGLDFVAFCEQFEKLTPELLRRLDDECRRHSDGELLLIPGYKAGTNIGNHMFFLGYDLPWPVPDVLTGPDNTLIRVQRKVGEPTSFIAWVLYDHVRYYDHSVGFYDFRDPRAMQLPDLKLNSMQAIMHYRDGQLVEDLSDDYILAVEGTLTGLPVSFNQVQSPDELAREVRSGNALTYAQAGSIQTLIRDALRWNANYDGINVFTSTGPVFQAWPATDLRSSTYGAEGFVVDSELMRSDLHVTAEAGLAEIRVLNGRRQIRRFLPNGAKVFRETLHLSRLTQQNLVAIATDLAGGTAVSFPRRSWRQNGLCVSFCGDHVNDCGRGLLARGTGMFRSHMFPEFPGGYSWDGGPKGLRPILHLTATHPALTSTFGYSTQLHAEGGGMNGLPTLETADDQAIVVRSSASQVYGPETTPINTWYTYGPIDPSVLMDVVRRYTEYNTPLIGVMPTGRATKGIQTGATMANFSSTVTFKKEQNVQSLRLQMSDPSSAQPAALVIGGRNRVDEFDLVDLSSSIDRSVDTGEWFGFYSSQTYNNALFINRGEPIRVRVDPGESTWRASLFADLFGKAVQAGDIFHHELFSVNEAIDTEARGRERFVRILDYLEQPEGMQILSGRRVPGVGYLDLEPDTPGEAVELKVPRPFSPIALTIPARVSGLNPRWSAGLFQVAGHALGNYTGGKDVYTTLGFDMEGDVHAALYPDMAPETHVVIGHPVTCSRPELILEVMPRTDSEGGYQWNVAVNNPTDVPVRATFRRGMELPGLDFEPQEHTIPAGGYVKLSPTD